MKYVIAIIMGFILIFNSSSYAQELAPPPPPETEKKEESKPVVKKKKKKVPHCSKQTAKLCESIIQFSDLSDEAWQIGAMAATLCSKSATIEQSRKTRKDRAEYEDKIARLAKKNGEKHTAWKPTETRQAFNKRTANECKSNTSYWCESMMFAAAELANPGDQAEALQLVDKACKGVK
jgi:hypothetical protein